MRSRMAPAMLICTLLLAGCGGSNQSNLAPPLVFPTQVQGPVGPAPLSLYFSATTTGASPQSSVSALNASDGTLRWSYQPPEQAQYDVKLESNVVYFGAADQQVYALDANSGLVRWHVKVGGFPLVAEAVDGVIYGNVATDTSTQFSGGPLFALNEGDGSARWHSQVSGSILGVVDGVVYVGGSTDNTLYALNASDGSVKWKFQAAYTPYEIDVEQGEVYAIDTVPNSGASSLYALDVSSGTLKWQYPANPDIQENVSLAGADSNAVYLIVPPNQNTYQTNLALALKASDGSTLWQYQTSSVYHYFLSSTLDSGVLYLGGNDGTLYAFTASNGKLHWHVNVGNTYVGIQAVNNSIVYTSVQTEGIQAVNSKDGSIRWRYQSNNSVQVLSVDNGLLYGVIQNSSFSTDMHSYAIALNAADGTTFWKYDGGMTSFFPIVG